MAGGERSVPRFSIQGLGLRVRVHRVGFRTQGSGFRVQGSGFRVRGSGFKVQSARFEITVGVEVGVWKKVVDPRSRTPASCVA